MSHGLLLPLVFPSVKWGAHHLLHRSVIMVAVVIIPYLGSIIDVNYDH